MKRFCVVVLTVFLVLAVGGMAFAAKKEKPPKNNIVVDVNGTGDFTDITSALYSITDNAVNNVYQVQVLPGTYVLNGPIRHTRDYVNIVGSGIGVTVLHFVGATNGYEGAVNLTATEISISNLSILYDSPVMNGGQMVGLMAASTPSDHVVYVSDVEIDVVNTGATGFAGGIYVGYGSSAVIQNVNIDAQSTPGTMRDDFGVKFDTYDYWGVANLTVDNCNINVVGSKAKGIMVNEWNSSNIMETDEIVITNNNVSASGGVEGIGFYWTGGLLDNVSTNLFSGNTFSVSVQQANGTTISDSTLIGAVKNDDADLVLVNCVDGAGNPI